MENHNVADNLQEFKITLIEFLYTYPLYTLEKKFQSIMNYVLYYKNCLLYWH